MRTPHRLTPTLPDARPGWSSVCRAGSDSHPRSRAVSAAARSLAAVGTRAAAVLCALTCLLVIGTPSATAHSPASTLVTISLEEASTPVAGPELSIDALVALQPLDLAYHTTLAEEAARDGAQATIDRHATALTTLFEKGVQVRSATGQAWQVQIESLTAGMDQDQDAVHAVLVARAPEAAATAQLTWQVVIDRVVTHTVYVGGVDAAGNTELIAELTRAEPSTELTVQQPAGPVGAGTLVVAGFDHFREGPDHLLFLCLVALGAACTHASQVRRPSTTSATPSPPTPQPGEPRNPRWIRLGWHLALLTLAFTVGHSISLAIAALGLLTVPTRWVETAIAVTIVLAALHAARTTLGLRSQVWVTLCFGLIHGFGFAGTLQSLALDGRALVLPLLGFNLGLEVAQLTALALTLPSIVVLARSVVATRVLAGIVGLVALGWIIERALAATNPLEPVVAVTLSSPERLAVVLAVSAALVWSDRRRRPTPAAPLPPPDSNVSVTQESVNVGEATH
ncbi:MAG: HupE/UreJ family protein [Actinomycetales bacterium]